MTILVLVNYFEPWWVQIFKALVIFGVIFAILPIIIILGGLLQISDHQPLVLWVAAGTVLLTSINIAGGFAVTRRMLDMFRK